MDKQSLNSGQYFNIKKVLLTIILGILTLIFSQLVSGMVYFLPLPRIITSIMYGILYVTISYFCIKICCNKILHISMETCFIGKPKIKIIWLIVAVLLPVMVSAILLCIPGKLTRNNINTFQLTSMIISSIFTAGLGAGVVEEMIFRGMIMESLERCFGKKTAIILPSVIFALLHIIGIKMNITDILMLLVAGTSVGIMFSLIVYESRSIWNSAIVHGIWNVIVIGNILHISVTNFNDAMYSYRLSSQSLFLTGGAFGVESSIIAIAGYIIVIALTLCLIKRKKEM